MFSRISFAALAFLFVTSPAFALGGASADCNGDGVNDISCSGSPCYSNDEGVMGNPGECICVSGNDVDHKTCANDMPKIIGSTFGEVLPGILFDLQAYPEATEPREDIESGPSLGNAAAPVEKS
ncbi:MAG: hypothetical protein AAFX50_07985 [Acidobacteriota bacterium]